MSQEKTISSARCLSTIASTLFLLSSDPLVVNETILSGGKYFLDISNISMKSGCIRGSPNPYSTSLSRFGKISSASD